MRALVSVNLIFVSLNQILLSVGSALLVILFARHLEQALFGELRYIIAVLAVLAFCSLPGIGLIINRSASELPAREIRDLIRQQLRWSVIAVVGALGFAVWHMMQGEPSIARAFAVGGLVSTVPNLHSITGLICAGLGHFRRKILLDSFIIVFAIFGTMFGVTWFSELYHIIGWYLGAQAGATLIAFFIIRDLMFPAHETETFPALTNHVREGAQLTLIQVPFLLIPAVEKVLIYLLLGPVSLAIFVIAVLPIEHFKSAFRNLIQVYMLPYLNHPSTHSLIHWVSIGLLVLSGGALALAAFILFGMPLLFPNYEAIRPFSLALMLSLLPLPIHVIAVTWIAKRQLITLSRFAFFSTVCSLLLIALGAWWYGLWGAIVGKILYEMVLAISLVRLDRPLERLPM